MSTWEYTVLKTATAGFWSGDELWELVSCFDTNPHHGTTRDVVAVLKRLA